MAEKKIEDFGKKIGGAKKDLWAKRGLRLEDLTADGANMNDAEKEKYIQKKYIWPKPDYDKMMDEENRSLAALYLMKMVRDNTPAKPKTKANMEFYLDFVSQVKDLAENLKTDEDVAKFASEYYKLLTDTGIAKYSTTSLGRQRLSFVDNRKANEVCSNKLLTAICQSASELSNEAIDKKFLITHTKAFEDVMQVYVIGEKGCQVERDYNGSYMLGVENAAGTSTTYMHPTNDEIMKLLRDAKNGDKVLCIKSNILVVSDDDRLIKIIKEATAEKLAGKSTAMEEKKKEAQKEKTAERKQKLVPPQLEDVIRDCPDDYRNGGHALGQDYIDEFGIRGGEYGNWMNAQDRQVSLDMGYDAFRDLAKMLGIPDEDIGLNGRLAIAFGARGQAGAAAHYEPEREVINLTKLNGAGSLAHEYFHAMDNIIGKTAGYGDYITNHAKDIPSVQAFVDAMQYKMAPSENSVLIAEKLKEQKQCSEDFKTMVLSYCPDRILTPEKIEERNQLIEKYLERAKTEDVYFMRYKGYGREMVPADEELGELTKFMGAARGKKDMLKKTRTDIGWKLQRVVMASQSLECAKKHTNEMAKTETDFYKTAKSLDGAFAKSEHGYWSSTIEMAARAFAVYAKDKMEEMGMRNDYLCGHADDNVKIPGTTIYLAPQGEERQNINKAIDEMIVDFKERGLLRDREEIERTQKDRDINHDDDWER